MKKFISQFWYTLNHPEEWHTISIIAVMIVLYICLGIEFGNAFDAFFELP